MNGQANVSHLPNVRAYVAPEHQTGLRVVHSAPHRESGDRAARKPFVAKGHDSQLQDAQFSGREIRLMTISGVECFGKIIRRDRYTITLEITQGSETGAHEIFYKHAIESVQVKKPAAADDAA